MQLSFAELVEECARREPERAALVLAKSGGRRGRKRDLCLTFRQLNDRAIRIAAGLRDAGVKRGDRVLVLLRPDMDFVSVNLAFNRILAVPVLFDLGMGIRCLLQCIRDCAPNVMIGIPRAYLLRRFFPGSFRSVRISIISQKSLIWRKAIAIETLASEKSAESAPEEIPLTPDPDELATIVFTSGSTGVAKGVEMTHRQISARRVAREEGFGLRRSQVELSTFPAFLLMSIASGRTCIVPDMDLTCPAKAKPANIVHAIKSHQADHFFAAPALLDRLTGFCVDQGIEMASVSLIVTGGAPVSQAILKRFRGITPNAEVLIAYGATEAIPVARILLSQMSGSIMEQRRSGMGMCVGHPVQETEVAVIVATEEEIVGWSEDLRIPRGDIGEIVVRGECVANRYFGNSDRTRTSTIPSPDGDPNAAWHRMGDLGFLDTDGRLWLCGRKAHRVESAAGQLLPFQVEGTLDEIPGVARTALVGVLDQGEVRPVIIYEKSKKVRSRDEEIEEAIRRRLESAGIEIYKLMKYRKTFPVDKRHNSKIERLQLAAWAQKRNGGIAR